MKFYQVADAIMTAWLEISFWLMFFQMAGAIITAWLEFL
jgi:hypothetical protein